MSKITTEIGVDTLKAIKNEIDEAAARYKEKRYNHDYGKYMAYCEEMAKFRLSHGNEPEKEDYQKSRVKTEFSTVDKKRFGFLFGKYRAKMKELVTEEIVFLQKDFEKDKKDYELKKPKEFVSPDKKDNTVIKNELCLALYRTVSNMIKNCESGIVTVDDEFIKIIEDFRKNSLGYFNINQDYIDRQRDIEKFESQMLRSPDRYPEMFEKEKIIDRKYTVKTYEVFKGGLFKSKEVWVVSVEKFDSKPDLKPLRKNMPSC